MLFTKTLNACSVRSDLKVVETMEIKALIVSKSTYDHLFLYTWLAVINFATKIFKVATKFS